MKDLSELIDRLKMPSPAPQIIAALESQQEEIRRLSGQLATCSALHDTRLIASAPELLDMCQKLKNCLNATLSHLRGDYSDDGHPLRMGCVKTLKDARAIIAKAEGKS